MGIQRKLSWPDVKYSLANLGAASSGQGVIPGGLDQITPSLRLQPGAVRDGSNYECLQSGGYGRIEGYERFSGQTSPSSATFVIVQVDDFATVPAIGDEISQAGSGATGVVAFVVDDDATGEHYMVVTDVTVGFDDSGAVGIVADLTVTDELVVTGELVVPTTTVFGTAIPVTADLTAQQVAQYLAYAADIFRSYIGPVPGSGNVIGVVQETFGGIHAVYAFRANIGNTAVNIYKSSTAGWVQVPLAQTIDFTGGGVSTPLDGDTLIQGGVTATIMRAIWQSGSFSGGTARGQFVIDDVSGGNFAAGAATTSSGTTLTLSDTPANQVLLPGGHFEFVKANFSGQATSRRIYGCDGVNKAFEFDGQTLAPITTGLTDDRPEHIAYHKNILFLSRASSMLGSAPGSPFKWTTTEGAFEVATGDDVRAMVSLPGTVDSATLAVYMRNNLGLLYGSDTSTFKFQVFVPGLGGLAYSAQSFNETFAFDHEQGVFKLSTTLNFGNFVPTSLSRNFTPFILAERAKVAASTTSRSKAQYRVFFSDGYGLYVTFANGTYIGSLPVAFPNPVFCCDTGEDAAQTEVTFFGSSDGEGYVYQLDIGPSFDGADIDAYLTLPWDAFKSPRILKRYRRASIEVQSSSYALIQFGYQLGYGTAAIAQPSQVSYETNFTGAPVWDSFTWDEFIWDGQTLVPSEVSVKGTAENIQYTIRSGTNYIYAYNVNSVLSHYTMRRGMR